MRRLWPHSKARERIREEKRQALVAVGESSRNRRRVEARGDQVNGMIRLLRFYSDNNGFADAFDEMLVSREGEQGHGVSG